MTTQTPPLLRASASTKPHPAANPAPARGAHVVFKHKHTQLFELLKDELMRGGWERGIRLPNMKELATRHNVSINVASKAVELLKEEGLVSVKVGDGIYSETSGESRLAEFRYSGERLFGFYRGTKLLRVLLQDSTPAQCRFWNETLSAFTERNPDIEMKVSFNIPERPPDGGFDLALGNTSFLTRHGFAPGETLPAAEVLRWAPDAYDGLLLRPDAAGTGGHLPYGFYYLCLFNPGGHPPPEPDEDLLGYLERLSALRPVRYYLRSSRSLLAHYGLLFFDEADMTFAPPPKERLLSVFSRLRTLYRAGVLVWPHGSVTDHMQQVNDARDEDALVEVHSNAGVYGLRTLMEPAAPLLPFPSGGPLPITAMAAAVRADCPLPEEAGRLVAHLLAPDVQRAARDARLFSSLRPDCPDEPPGAVEALRSGRFVPAMCANPEVDDLYYRFAGWELLYYLEGRRGDEVGDLLPWKMAYFWNHRQRAATAGKTPGSMTTA